jgi:hypothetical protein
MSELAWIVEIETPLGHEIRRRYEVVMVDHLGKKMPCCEGQNFETVDEAEKAMEEWCKKHLDVDMIKRVGVEDSV